MLYALLSGMITLVARLFGGNSGSKTLLARPSIHPGMDGSRDIVDSGAQPLAAVGAVVAALVLPTPATQRPCYEALPAVLRHRHLAGRGVELVQPLF